MSGYRYSALVVDDEESVRSLTARSLERYGFACTQACNGVEGSRLLATRNFQVLVTDLRMPDGNGYSLALDQLERVDRPLIVILTGVLEPRIAQDLLRRGVDDIMFKPVDYEMFAGKLVGLVERRAAGDAPGANGLAANNWAALSGSASQDSSRDDQTASPAPPEPASEPQSPVEGGAASPHVEGAEQTGEVAASTPSDGVQPVSSEPSCIAPTGASRESLSTHVVHSISLLQHALTSVQAAWWAAGGLLLFSVWLWLQVHTLQQANRMITALEQLGARVTAADHGGASVSFDRGRRPSGLDELQNIPDLRQLSFADTAITDQDLQALRMLKDLEELDLEQTGITDAGLEHLSELKNLRTLSLSGTQVTNAGLRHLKRLRTLRALSLLDTNISATGVQELQKAMPFAKIDHASSDPAGADPGSQTPAATR